MQICSLVISKYGNLTITSEAAGCCFPKQNTRGKVFPCDVPCFLHSAIVRLVIIELSSLFPRLPPAELGGNHIFFFSVQLFTVVPREGPWLKPVASKLSGLRNPLKETPLNVTLSSPTALRSRQQMLTPYFTKKGSLPEVSQKVGHQSSRCTACSLLKCRQLQVRKVVAPKTLQ